MTSMLRKLNSAVDRAFTWVTEPTIGRFGRWIDRNPIFLDTVMSLIIIALLVLSIGTIWLIWNIWGSP